jgi:hypothetical protein
MYPEPGQSSPYPTYYFLKIRLNIILPSTPGSPQWPLCLWFLHQNPVHASPLPHTRYMFRPSHSSRVYHPYNCGSEVQIIKLTLWNFLHSPVTSSLLSSIFSEPPYCYYYYYYVGSRLELWQLQTVRLVALFIIFCSVLQTAVRRGNTKVIWRIRKYVVFDISKRMLKRCSKTRVLGHSLVKNCREHEYLFSKINLLD